MLIKKAEANDFDIVKNITAETIRTIYPRYYPCGAVDFFLNHHNDENIMHDIKSGFVYLLEENKSAVGTVTLKKNEICRLFVLPQYQKMGYGRTLLDFAEDKILKNHNEILIDASLPAKKIYLKRGYIETNYNTIITENSDFLCYDEMKKILKK